MAVSKSLACLKRITFFSFLQENYVVEVPIRFPSELPFFYNMSPAGIEFQSTCIDSRMCFSWPSVNP